MRKSERMKKVLSALLCLCMLVQNCPVMAFAAETDNLCAHHTEHTAECGYREGIAGSACNHNHSEDCYKIVACRHTCGDACANGCGHSCTVENGCVRLELDCHHTHSDCGYSEGTAEVPCGHSHNESCGYVEALAGTPCANAETAPECDHTGDCGYVAAVEGQPCGHAACDDTCGYAPATEGTPCTHTHSVKVNSTNSCYKLLCSHKDGGHDDACGYVAAAPAHDCSYECTECSAALTADEATEPSTETTEPSTEETELAPVCTCGTDDVAIHATTCTVYAAPENPECFCVEKCTEVNVWCDICGFDVTACQGGEDTAAVYLEVGDTFVATFDGISYNFTVLADSTVELTGLAGEDSPTELSLKGSVVDGNGRSYDITAVGANAFQECKTLTKLDFGIVGSTVKTIGDHAFEACTSLEEVSFQMSAVTHIGIGAFSECTTLKNCWLSSSSNLQQIGAGAFAGCKSLESISLTNTKVTDIGDSAFMGCKSLTSAELSYLNEGSLTLGHTVFADCEKLTNVSFPDYLTEIPTSTFSHCKALSNIKIPDTVTVIGDYAFENCTNLKRVVFGSGEAPAYYAVNGGEGSFSDVFPSHLHELIVVDGMGDGAYATGEQVQISYSSNPAYTCKGWTVTGNATLSDASAETTTLTMGSGNSTVTPILEETIYTITYDANGGSSDQLPDNMTAKYGEQFVLPTKHIFVYKDNADFQGWMIEGTLYQPGDTYTVTGNVTIYAHWLNYFKLWFIVDQTTDKTVTRYAYEPDYQFTLPECDYEIYERPDGKNFKAWLVGDVEYKAGETITLTENYYVYPVWEDAVTGTVTFSPGDEPATGSMEPITVEAGKTITLPECGFTPTNDTVLFYGWKINGTYYKPGTECMVVNDVTAEAIWSNRHYTITFDANGGTGSMEPMYAFPLDAYCITMPECGFTPPEGYRFKGWQVDEYNVKLPGVSWQFSNATTVKAVWELDETSSVSVNITWGAMSFTYTDGEWNPETHTYAVGEWTPDNENGNVITVTNNGNVAVNVSLSYENAEGYSFTGTFDTSSATLAAGNNKTFTLTLNGKPTESMTAEVIGTVTVSITLPEG